MGVTYGEQIMPLRFLLRYFANNEKVVEKLAESYPMRRAAQLGAYFYFKSKHIGYKALQGVKESGVETRVKSFSKTFSDQVQEGFRDLKQQKKN